MKKKIRIGLDFDGVVAYNPFRVIRSPWAFFKRNFLGVKKLTFYYPDNKFKRFIWKIMHDSSMFPAKGTNLLNKLKTDKEYELHLVTGRYSFLDGHLNSWLDKYNLKKYFKTINLNRFDEQPHLFKEKMIKKFSLEIFVEDNWDIVEYLSQKKDLNCEIYWIYNLLDRFRPYPNKFPYLEKALEEIIKSIKY